MTKADLVENVYLKTGFSKKESAEIVEMVFDLMKNTLENGTAYLICHTGPVLGYGSVIDEFVRRLVDDAPELARIDTLPNAADIKSDIAALAADRPAMYMVDSDKGITNLHVPSDVIIDASMPAAIRSSGKMWGPDGKLHDAKMVIPDRCYAGIYQEIIQYCKDHGAFDVTTMGNVSNVGLMAQKAEEYGSHDKTFEIRADGKVTVTDDDGNVVMEHEVHEGDIWRMCQTRDLPIRDWVRLAVSRARATGAPAVFWLDPYRPHDAELIKKVERYLAEHDLEGLDIQRMSQVRAMRYSLERIIRGVILGSLIMLSIAFFLRSVSYSRLLFVIFGITSVIALSTGRLAARRMLRRSMRKGAASVRVLFVGNTGMRGRLEETFRETPGLGDDIEIERSDWILGFAGKSLDNPPAQQWKVRKDGGYFDQFTGATITPRAVVKAVHNTLLYFTTHKQEILAADGKPDHE